MDAVFPWYRLGMVQPHHTNLSIYQTYRIAPEGVLCYLTSLDLREYTLEQVEANLPKLWDLLDSLRTAGSERIVLGGVPVAAALGRSKVLEILKDMEARTGVPATSSFEDHLLALEHVGARRVAVANRWPEALNVAVKDYLEGAGYEVVGYRFGGGTLQENKRTSPEGDHELALQLGRQVMAAAPDADALIMPGGNGYFLYAAPVLEAEFDVPVLTNATATLWAALHGREGGILQRPDPRWGRLLASL